MFTSTIILAGTIVVEGKPFRWWVTDGLSQRLTVSHPFFGTDSQPLTRSPMSQAQSIGRTLLNKHLASIVEPLEDLADDAAAFDECEIPSER